MAGLTVGVLGPVEAHRDGVRLELPTGKTTELLARLALDAGGPVRVDTLLEDLWAEPTARNTLQSKVSQLRRALGERAWVTGSPDSYMLALTPDAVDAHRVLQLAHASATARAAGDSATSLDAARAGLALFRGLVLADAGDWAAPHRSRLEEVRLALLEDALSDQVDLGEGREVIAELGALVVEHPLREGLWVALITALYQDGRQGEALAAYAEVRRVLADELGVDPGAQLVTLQRQVLQHSADLKVRPTTGPGNVPAVTTTTVGREEDLRRVVSAVRSHRLVTVVGPGGVGKTRLAVEAARRLGPIGEVWLVRLDAVDADAVLGDVVAESLHVSGGEPALRDRLTGTRAVLLLDNCEHVLGPVARLVESLLTALPGLRVLATSQAPLGLEGEWIHPLAPLTQTQSVALFADRAAELRPDFVLDAPTAAAAAEVCRALDGLPLAIELAASRVRSLAVVDIARRLDDRFAILRDPNSPRPERRRALEAAIGWSYDLLFPDDQRGLWALACFAGSATLDATEQVLTALGVPGPAVIDTVSRLVARSLVGVEPQIGGEVRYRLLDSVRTYANQRLRAAGHADVAARAHAAWYARTAAWCEERVRGPQQPICMAIARAERANIDAALAWCAAHDPGLGVRIANGFGWTWVVLGDGTAGAARVRNALAGPASARDRATGGLLAAWLEASAGDISLAQADLDRARALAGELGDGGLRADLDRHQAFLAIQQGRPELAVSAAAASLASSRAHGDVWSGAASLLLLAYGQLMLGETASASAAAAEAVSLLSPLEDSWGLVHGQGLLGAIAQAEHRWDDAARALERAADESGTLGFLGQAALHRSTLGRVQQRAGDDRAETNYQQAIQEAVAGGDGRLAATTRLQLARLQRSSGARAEAVALLEQNQEWYAAAGGGDFALLTDCLLAACRDDSAGLTRALDQARAGGNREVEVSALDALARLAADRGDASAAESRLADADRLAPEVDHLLDDRDRVDAAAARRQLGLSRP